jgi:hypothetical protein
MGTGRFGAKHSSSRYSGVTDTTDKFLNSKYGKSAFMRDLHSANPKNRGLNSALNANPGNYVGGSVEPEPFDFFDSKTRTIDFKAYQKAHDEWEQKYKNSQDPYYADLNSYQINCQRCVIAWEANYRGYDVEARPNPSGNNDGFDKAYGSNNFLSTFRNADGTIVQPLVDKFHFQVAGAGKGLRTEITNVMLQQGNGARFVIDFGRKNSLSGHTFTAEVVGNKVVVYEPQYAKTASLAHYINNNTHRVRVTRVDNAYLDHTAFDKAVIPHGTRRHSNHGGSYKSRK